MFSELIRRNSKRNRQENTLYFVTMILTVAAFYIILALDHQDVMIFLKEMERDAVNKLLMLIPILYVVSLCLLYFLVYFTDKYQMERRSHEFGTYVMLGMKKRSLFQMLFLEDLRNIVYALVIGIRGAADLGTYKPDYGEACRIWNSASSVYIFRFGCIVDSYWDLRN